MASRHNVDCWLIESGYTHEDIDKFWSICIKGNSICSMYAKEGKSWVDLKMIEIQEIPKLKDEILAKKRRDKEKYINIYRNREERKRYYIEHIDEIILKKINQGKSLSREELYKMTEFSIKRTYGENRNWQRSVTDVCKLGSRYFMLNWEEGLTARECNDYDSQPIEVFPHRSIRVIEEITYNSSPDNYFILEECYKSNDVELAFNSIKEKLSKTTGENIKTKEEIVDSKQ